MRIPRAAKRPCPRPGYWPRNFQWLSIILKSTGRSAYVYSPYVLCRSLEVWQSILSVDLPGDIRNLIESTYAVRQEHAQMSRLLSDLDNGTRWRTGRNSLRQLARVGLAEAGNTLPESKVQTRYSETDNFDVLLLRACDA